jgi:hemolysin activation/secretion protein
VDFEALYDSLSTSNLQAQAEVDFSYFIPTGRVGALKLSLNGLYKYNSSTLLTNELIRVGGNRNLRGFDEESFFVDRYFMFTTEYRFILDKNSFLSLPFIHVAHMRRRVDDVDITDTPIGVGLGISFSTPAGLFNVSFAAGKEMSRGFDFNNTKVHFGYLSRF